MKENFPFSEKVAQKSGGWIHSRSKQRTDQRVFSTYTQIFSPKKTGFSPVKNTSQFFFDFFYLYSMQLFSADPTIFAKKNFKKLKKQT